MQKKIALKFCLQSYFFLWNYKRVIDILCSYFMKSLGFKFFVNSTILSFLSST